jgi:hypothetical protein
MLLAHLGKEVRRRAGASGFHVVMASADPFDGILEILAIPFQIGSQRFIECDGRILPTPLAKSTS